MYGGATLLERCRRVYHDYQDYLENRDKYWFCLARKEDWPVPNEPAIHLPNTVRIPGALLFVWIHKCIPCCPNPDGDIHTPNRNYMSIHPENAKALVHSKSHFLYYEAEFSSIVIHRNHPYHIVALCRAVHQTKYQQPQRMSVVYPEEVRDYETLWIGSTKKIQAGVGTTHRLQLLRVF